MVVKSFAYAVDKDEAIISENVEPSSLGGAAGEGQNSKTHNKTHNNTNNLHQKTGFATSTITDNDQFSS